MLHVAKAEMLRTLLESSSRGRVTSRETTIISMVPDAKRQQSDKKHHPDNLAYRTLCGLE